MVAVSAAAGGTTAWLLSGKPEQPTVWVDRSADREPGAGTHFTAYQAEQYPDLTYAAENAVQAVVNIEVVQRVEMPQSNYGYDFFDPFREFFGLPQQRGISTRCTTSMLTTACTAFSAA